MFLWTYRQVVGVLILLAFCAIAIGSNNSRYQFWFDRTFSVALLVMAIVALAYILRK
jgi:hypothetical protein